MRNIKISCIILFFAFLSQTANAQALNDSVSVIISPGTSDAKTISDIRGSIKALSGIRFIGYCSNHNVFLLYIDRKVHGAATDFCSKLNGITGSSTVYLKKGTIQGLLNICNFSDPGDAAQIKAQLDK